MVRVYQRGPSTGTSTGGGTGGGTGSGSVSSGGYDRYIGTIGLAADNPNSGIFPHYTAFPAGNKYDWLRSVSSTTVDSKVIVKEQEFICTENNTPASTATKWQLRQNIARPGLILTHYFNRNRLNITINAPPGQLTPIPFALDPHSAGKAIYFDNYRTEITNWGIPYDPDAEPQIVDIYGSVSFSENPEGFRNVRVYLQEFNIEHPAGAKNAQGALLRGSSVDGGGEGSGGFVVGSGSANAAPVGVTVVQATRSRADIDMYSDVQTIAYLYVNHNAPITLQVTSAAFAMTVWKKI